ncbi:uncharacterized protein LOC123531545 [Mercenaria mercenaria]|uniref:uncharacterized protein LOC123531545 n=1 Tax=Mercenaria mercenaria TaxID=6596 RepID=UPI00234F7B94|nr:uncharacterized protein LOC123531545 [Mercenaria mercenaria]
MATYKRNSRHLVIIVIFIVIVLHQGTCQDGFKLNKKAKGPLDRSINEIKENVSFPTKDGDSSTKTEEIDNEITTEKNHITVEKSTRPTTANVRDEPTVPTPTSKPTVGHTQQKRDKIDPVDQYLLEGILDIVDEKFNTLNKRLMTLERGINNVQYYNVRSFRVVNTHLHAVDTILHTMHTQVGQSEQQNKFFEQSIAGMKNEIIDLQTMNNGMFQAIEQNLVHFHQDLGEKLSSVTERVEQSNAQISQLKNASAEIKTSIEQIENTQKDLQQNSETSVLLTSEILQKSARYINSTTDIKNTLETVEERTKQMNNTVDKLSETVSILSTDTFDIKQGLATTLTNISIAKFDQDLSGSEKEDFADKTSYQEFRAKNSQIQMSCGKMLEILDEKLKHINVTLSEGQTKEDKCDKSNVYPADFKTQSKKLLRALSTVNENVFQSVTLYKHTGNLIERVISDTEYIASEQVRLREELVAYLMNGTFDLFNQSIPDFAEIIATRNKDQNSEEAANESQTCTVTKSLVDEILKISFNGTQLVHMLTELATTSSSSIQLSIDKLDQEISRLNKIQEQPLLSAPFNQKPEAFIRDDPKAGGSAQIKDIQNKTDWIYQLSEAIASNTGWIPYVFHNLRFVENQVNKTLKLVTNIDARSEELLIRHRANMAIMFKSKQKMPTPSPVAQAPFKAADESDLPEKQSTYSENGCSVNSNQSALYEHMMRYVYSTNMKLNRLIPALTNLLGEPEPYIALVDGETDREGRVEVYHKGQWGTIAGILNHVEASYVCRKLGYLGGISAGSGNFGAGSGQFWDLNVTCLRTRWCSAVSHVANSSRYDHSKDVGVICDHMLRLTQTNEDEEPEVTRQTGKLEIYHQNNWLPICSKGWGRRETDVACKQLGFREGAATAVKDESLSDSNWLTNVTCKGSENRLDACVFESFESNGCPDMKYVSLICS